LSNREMMTAVARAGISRREPLRRRIRPPGTTRLGRGYERYQYGRQVNAGKRQDPHFLHVEYSAPEKATDADIEATSTSTAGQRTRPGGT
jgi:phage terminase large subunit-like protein